MKRAMAAASCLMTAAVAWLGMGTGGATAQVLWPEPAPPGAPPTFGSQMTGRSEAGGSLLLPIIEEQISVDVDGQHASTRLRQVFHNRTGDRVEGLYALRAGPGVRANGFAYWNGERKIVGEVFERGVARQVYQNVTRARRDPGLLEQTGDGAFTFAVSPIEPGERKRVEVSYTQWLPRRAATVELHAPVTRPDSDVTVSIWDTRELRDITSTTHHLDVQRMSNGRYLLRARKARAATPEIVIRYQIADKPWSVTGYVHRDKEQDAYFTLSLAAPDLPASATMAKDVTLVIDRSGSMMGEPIRQARAACIDIVKHLRSDDRLNILLFDHQVEKLFNEPKPVTEAIRRQAVEYLEMMDEGGATDLALALEQAMASQASSSNRPRTVLFFTDGRSAVKPVLDAAQADKRDVRVFTVGFGPEVNRPLLARLAAHKRGRFTYISAASNIEREVATLYRQIDAPVLVDVSLETEGGAVGRVYPQTLPDLFVDDELRISGRLRAAGPVAFTLKGRQGGRPFARTIKLQDSAEIKRPWVARQWAAARVEDLLDEIALGNHGAEIQNEVLNLALAYNFTTPYTAFLAIPESEVDWASARQLESARAYKAEILRRKPDAAHVAGAGGDDSGTAVASNQSSRMRHQMDLSSNRRSSSESAAPASAPVSEREAADEGPAPMARHAPKKMASNEDENPLDEKEGPIRSATLGSSRREPGGCASCALGGSGASPFAALAIASLATVIAARRRRR